jgi:hypothetical protein
MQIKDAGGTIFTPDGDCAKVQSVRRRIYAMNRRQITFLVLALPRQGDFTGADLSGDRQEELQRVESAPK